MTSVRRMLTVAGIACLGAAGGTYGTDVPAEAKVDPEVLQLREAAWRAWFSGDEPALRRMLPPEFIGIGMNDGPFTSLALTLEQARGFRSGGGRLVRLEFPETRAQRYGDVMVLYGRYSAVIESGGAERTVGGRLTEVFVRQGGRWLHPGWHLDTVATP